MRANIKLRAKMMNALATKSKPIVTLETSVSTLPVARRGEANCSSGARNIVRTYNRSTRASVLLKTTSLLSSRFGGNRLGKAIGFVFRPTRRDASTGKLSNSSCVIHTKTCSRTRTTVTLRIYP